MHLTAAITLPLVLLASEVAAAGAPYLAPQHARIARRMNRKKRCVQRGSSQNNNVVLNLNGSSSSATTTTTSAAAQPTTPAPNPTPDTHPLPQPNPGNGGGGGGHQSGTINVQSTCGDIGATTTTGFDAGPNGSIYWLTCGINGGGWNPPSFSTSDMIAADLNEVLSRPGNPFDACRPLLDIFYSAAAANDLPPILLASIAMQESSCNPGAVGGGGEQGLMQLSQDKCGDAPGGDCRDPNFNINKGASYLRGEINRLNGNVAQAMGAYNGWQPGMTIGSATAAAYTGCCRCQNNLDYLHQLFNGWCQGISPGSIGGMAVYHNLDVCQ